MRHLCCLSTTQLLTSFAGNNLALCIEAELCRTLRSWGQFCRDLPAPPKRTISRVIQQRNRPIFMLTYLPICTISIYLHSDHIRPRSTFTLCTPMNLLNTCYLTVRQISSRVACYASTDRLVATLVGCNGWNAAITAVVWKNGECQDIHLGLALCLLIYFIKHRFT